MSSRFTRGNNHPPPAPEEIKPTHGAGTLLRLYRERDLDLRRSDHRAIHEWQLALVEDLGGQSQVDTFQRSMIDRATELLIIISAMASHVENGAIMEGKELAPCLRASFLQYTNTFRHCLIAAFEHGGKKSKKIPDLKDYLENLPKEEHTDDSRESIPKENSINGGAGETRRRRFEFESGGREGAA
jgi:hypothetical protein